MRIQKPQKKLYYSLRQVCDMLGVSDNVLKSWEKEFSQIKPVRNRADNRYFVEKDLALLFYIKELLVDKKLSYDEARGKLKSFRNKDSRDEHIHLKKMLAEVKLEVREMLKILENR